MKTANLVSSMIAILIAAFFFIMTFQFKEINVQDTGPAFLPRLYAGILVILAILLFINSYKSKTPKNEDTSTNFKLVFITMVLMIGLISLIPIIGFYIATPIAVFIFLKIFKQKNLFLLIGLPIGIVVCVYLLFQRILLVPLPSGIIFQ